MNRSPEKNVALISLLGINLQKLRLALYLNSEPLFTERKLIHVKHHYSSHPNIG